MIEGETQGFAMAPKKSKHGIQSHIVEMTEIFYAIVTLSESTE